MATFAAPGDELVTIGGFPTGLSTPSVPFAQWPGGRGVTMVGDRVVSFAELYATQPMVAATAHKIVRQVMRLPLKVYRRTEDGRERIRSGYLFDVLRQPWPRAAAGNLKQAMLLPTLVHGNGVLVKQRRPRRSGPVRSLIPVAWPMLAPRLLGGGEVEMWENTGRHPDLPRWVNPEDVIHVAFRGLDGALGVSPLQQLGVTLAIEDAAQRHQKSLLRNGAKPTGVLKQLEGYARMPVDERQAAENLLREDVDAVYAGPDNSGRPVILPFGLEWQSTQHDAVEAELIAQRELAREEVCAVYDIPPPLVGVLEHATLANVEEFNRMLFTAILSPWLTLIEETVWAQMIAEEPTIRGIDQLYVEFDLSEVLKGDLLKRSQALALQIGYGVMTLNDARELENRTRYLNPLANEPLIPANNLRPLSAGFDAPPSDGQVADAAQAVAAMGHDDLRRMIRAHGSIVDVIEAMATPPDPAAGLPVFGDAGYDPAGMNGHGGRDG